MRMALPNSSRHSVPSRLELLVLLEAFRARADCPSVGASMTESEVAIVGAMRVASSHARTSLFQIWRLSLCLLKRTTASRLVYCCGLLSRLGSLSGPFFRAV